MTKWPVQKPTHRTTQKHVEHLDVTDIQEKTKDIYIEFPFPRFKAASCCNVNIKNILFTDENVVIIR